MNAPVVFLDTETTGLDPVLDDIWEFAAVRREPDGSQRYLHLFIEHDEERCQQLPESFRQDHINRWPGLPGETSRKDAAFLIDTFLRGDPTSPKAHVVGAVPNFDTERISRLMRAYSPNVQVWREPFHYHLIDVENLAVGFLRGRFPDLPLDPPWESDHLSELLGISIVAEERHTAMGDVRWAMRIYDRIMKGSI